ncbi:MAG: NahK/ErcS family hybrid sensor histidine kinase/response regulator [Motiliproteus sp.]
MRKHSNPPPQAPIAVSTTAPTAASATAPTTVSTTAPTAASATAPTTASAMASTTPPTAVSTTASATAPSAAPTETTAKMQQRPQPSDEDALLQNLIGLGDFSARKSYYPELLGKINELEQEKERYVWLFENALHGIFQARIDGPVTAANPAIARICGYDSAEQFQQIEQIGEQLFYPEDYRRLLQLLKHDGQKVGFETQFRTRSGAPVSISTNVLLKDREQGLIEAFVQDITGRKQAEAALNQLNTELEQRVNDRTRELSAVNNQLSSVNQHLRQEIQERTQIETALQTAKQDAEDANASKDKYLAAASHDLLQPLNAARLLISALQDKSLGAENQLLVERTHEALGGAEALLTDLLDISKLDANAVTADLTLFSAAELISALTSESEPLAQQAGLGFASVNCHAIIRSDSRLLMRILRNFISNAIRYTEQGRIVLGCRRRGAQLELQVLDTGPGIPADKRQDIFREFHQLSPHQLSPHHDGAQPSQSFGRSKGVGLGLAIVDRIAKMLDHRIELRSCPGHGSCFSIRVPIATSITPYKTQRAAPPPPALGSDLTGVRVLVIENEESIRIGMTALLQQWGCEIKTADGITQAQSAYAGQAPDIILADYHLDQGVTGVDVIEALKQGYPSSQQPIPPAIMITADRSDVILKLFQHKGLTRLNKPIKPGKLRALMSHLLNPKP